MTIKKLSIEDRQKIDAVGWHAVMAYSERENGHQVFNSMHFKGNVDNIKNDKHLHLYLIFDNDIEVGRFGVREVGDKTFCLTGMMIYSIYRRKGYFKRTLEYLLETYDTVFMYSSNKYVVETLFKDSRFISQGWDGLTYNDSIEIRFISKDIT